MSVLTAPETLRDLGASGVPVARDTATLEAARSDRSGLPASGTSLAVVRARTVDDVVTTLRWAHANRVPVVPRGAGTGLAGGATAGHGTVALDLTALDRIVELDPVDQLAVVEPGVITAALDRAARGHGLRYAPDPGSWEQSTIGGNIATNAGGLRCSKYGATGDAVLALDVVLADGTLVRTGSRAPRSVVGYDLTSLFVGSEGTLGVVVGATLRLSPVPVATATVAASFADVAAAARAAAALVAAGVRPATLELLDGATLEAIDAGQGTALREHGAAFLLVQTDGFGAAAEAAVVATVLAPTATHLEVADDDQTAVRLADVRRLALPSIERLGPVLVEDVCVPRSALGEAFARIAAVSARTGVPVHTFAHAGDGILHPIVRADHHRSAEAVDAVVRVALDLGGSLTGEHGVGELKRPWLADDLGAATVRTLRTLKDALDHRGILNPDKAI